MQHHVNPGKWLRECFPEQTKTPAHIVVWAIVYLLDTALVFWVASVLGIDLLSISYRFTTVLVCVYLILAFLLFWAETAIYNRILANYRKTLE